MQISFIELKSIESAFICVNNDESSKKENKNQCQNKIYMYAAYNDQRIA